MYITTHHTSPHSHHTEPEELWSVRRSAAYLGYADGTVRNLIAKGRLPRVKLKTGTTRIPSEAVRAFARGQVLPKPTND